MSAKMILYGSGNVGKEALNFFGEELVAYFCDSNKALAGMQKYGKEVISISKLKEIYEDHILMICTVLSTADEIADMLYAIGIEDFLVYRNLQNNVLREMQPAEFVETYSDSELRKGLQRDYYRCRTEQLKHQLAYLQKHADITALKPATGYFRKWQMDQVDFAQEFFAYIAKLDIKPFLIGGGLIGAVRHGGFVPWDDDLDFGLMRDDYEKLIDFCKKNCVVYQYEGDWETYITKEESDEKLVELVRTHPGEWILGMSINEVWVEKGGAYIRTAISFWPFDYYKEDYAIEEHNRYLAYIKEKREELKTVPDIIQFQREEIRTNSNISKTPTSKIQPGIDNGAWEPRYGKGRGWIKTEDMLPLEEYPFEGEAFFVPHNPQGFLDYDYPDYLEFPRDLGLSEHMGGDELYLRRHFPSVEFYLCNIGEIDQFLPLYQAFEENRIYANFVLRPRERNGWGGELDIEGAVKKLDAAAARYSDACSPEVDFAFTTKGSNVLKEYCNKKVRLVSGDKTDLQELEDNDGFDFQFAYEGIGQGELDRILHVIQETGYAGKK